MRFRTLLATASAALVIAACGDDGYIAPPTADNVVDTVTLGALFHNDDITLESAYSISLARPVRTDASGNFDFAFDVDSTLGPVLLPAEVTGVFYPSKTNPGLQRMTVPFDSIVRARSNGYVTNAPLTADSGDVFLARSLISCGIGVPLYAKLQILAVDTVANTVTFQIMVNQNCGYRGLEPGLPSD